VYTTENALTFADMAKAVQRSAGLGQVTCPDGSIAPDALSCLPVETPGGGGLLPVATEAATTAEQPYYTNFLGMQLPTSTLLIGGIIAAIALGAAFFGGARR
jgi:hypothetical protein